MLTYYTDKDNIFTIRTAEIGSLAVTMSLQDMYKLKNTTASLYNLTYERYESILSFTASISGAYEGAEYRVDIRSGSSVIWDGCVQVFGAQTASKAEYETVIDGYKSHLSTNEYIITT